MDYKLITRHFKSSKEVEEHIDKKMKKLARFAKWIQHVEVIIDGEKNRRNTEINVTMNHKKINAKAEGDDAFKTIAAAFGKVERQVKKFEEKVTQHHHGKK
jgi:putative sigma-54 modulation protein